MNTVLSQWSCTERYGKLQITSQTLTIGYFLCLSRHCIKNKTGKKSLFPLGKKFKTKTEPKSVWTSAGNRFFKVSWWHCVESNNTPHLLIWQHFTHCMNQCSFRRKSATDVSLIAQNIIHAAIIVMFHPPLEAVNPLHVKSFTQEAKKKYVYGKC